MCNYIGIDVSKDKLDIVVLTGEGAEEFEVENGQKGHQAWVKRLRQAGSSEGQVCMEATGTYYEGVAEALQAADFHSWHCYDFRWAYFG